MEMAFAILTEVTGDVVGHLTRYGRVGGCRCHVLPQLRRLVCLPLGLEDVILFLGLLSLHPGKVLVVDVLIQVLVEDVADTAPP